MTLTLRVRLTAIYTAVFGLLLATLSLVSYRMFARTLDTDATDRVAELAEGLHGFIRFDADGPLLVYDAHDAGESAFVREATQFYQVLDRDSGLSLASSLGFEFLGASLTPDQVRRAVVPPGPADFSSDRGRVRVVSSFGQGAAGNSYLLRVGAPMAAEDAALDSYRELLLWPVPLALIAAALTSWWIARLALAPLARVAAAARRIDISTLTARLPLRGADDELDEVAGAFNETLARLERAVAEMRQFRTALAHELRTPLTALRGEIELELRRSATDERLPGVLGSQLEEVDKLKRLIDQLLTLARAESGQIQLARTSVDLGALAGALVEQLVPVAESLDIALRFEGAEPVTIAADPIWLERLTLNLLDNALKYTPAGGRILVSVGSSDGGAMLTVQDSGIGIEASVTGRIFERFFRVDPSRSSPTGGAGLGLSLVRWIVDAHEGRIRVASHPGRGSTFIVWLPARVRVRTPPIEMNESLSRVH